MKRFLPVLFVLMLISSISAITVQAFTPDQCRFDSKTTIQINPDQIHPWANALLGGSSRRYPTETEGFDYIQIYDANGQGTWSFYVEQTESESFVLVKTESLFWAFDYMLRHAQTNLPQPQPPALAWESTLELPAQIFAASTGIAIDMDTNTGVVTVGEALVNFTLINDPSIPSVPDSEFRHRVSKPAMRELLLDIFETRCSLDYGTLIGNYGMVISATMNFATPVCLMVEPETCGSYSIRPGTSVNVLGVNAGGQYVLVSVGLRMGWLDYLSTDVDPEALADLPVLGALVRIGGTSVSALDPETGADLGITLGANTQLFAHATVEVNGQAAIAVRYHIEGRLVPFVAVYVSDLDDGGQMATTIVERRWDQLCLSFSCF